MTTFSKLGDVLKDFNSTKDKYVSREFQKYGYDLAEEMGEPGRVSYYIKLSKEYPRALLETARSFVKDAYNVKSKGKLFTWKLMQLKKEKVEKDAKKN